jgi:hypothetical protein
MTTSSSACSEYVKSPPVVIAAKKLYAIASDSKQLVSSVEAVRLVSPKAQELHPVAPAKLYFPGKQSTQPVAPMAALVYVPLVHSVHAAALVAPGVALALLASHCDMEVD